MYQTFGYKVRDTKTGLFAGPGILGQSHWSNVGRTWTRKGDLSGSIGVWLNRLKYRYGRVDNRKKAEDWNIVLLTDHGIGEVPFVSWVDAKENKLPFPEPVIAAASFTREEIDLVETALIEGIGDADASGELIMRVMKVMKCHERS